MKNFLFLLPVLFTSCLSDEGKRDDFFIEGNRALGEGEYTLAIEHYTNALEVDGEFYEALNNRGVAYVESDHAHEAILDYNLALQINPEYDECRINRAYAYELIGQFKNAFRDIDVLVMQSPDSAYLHFYKGIILSHLRDFEESIASFNRAIALGDTSVDVLVNIATLHYFNQRLDSSKYYLDKALKIAPNQPNAFNTLSQVLVSQQDHIGAMFAIERALEQVPREPYFLNNRGMIYLMMDSIELGLQDINKSILLNPKNGWSYRNKGVYYTKVGEYAKAIEMFDRAKESAEFIDELYYYLGQTYLQMGEGFKACEAWKEGLANGEKRCEAMAVACGN